MRGAQILTTALLILAVAMTAVSVGHAHGQPRAVGEIVICTGHGPVTIAVDADGQPTQANHLCPDCVVKLTGPPVQPFLALRDAALRRNVFGLAARPAAGLRPVLDLRARAPPVVV